MHKLEHIALKQYRIYHWKKSVCKSYSRVEKICKYLTYFINTIKRDKMPL